MILYAFSPEALALRQQSLSCHCKSSFTRHIFDDNIRSTEVTVWTSSISVSSSTSGVFSSLSDDQKARKWSLRDSPWRQWRLAITRARTTWHSAGRLGQEKWCRSQKHIVYRVKKETLKSNPTLTEERLKIAHLGLKAETCRWWSCC